MSEKLVNVGSNAIHEKPNSNPSSISQDDVEGVPQPGTTVQLKRRLQSRHLQMIAIGKQALNRQIPGLRLTVEFRWHNRYRSLHRFWIRSRKFWSRWRIDRICLHRYPRLQCHGRLGRDGHLHSYRWSFHRVRCSFRRSRSRIRHGLDLLVFMGHHIRSGVDG